MQQFQQPPSFPFHLYYSFLNQGNSLGLHFPASYHQGFPQLPQFNQINLLLGEEKPQESLNPIPGYRKSFPRKRSYRKKNKSSVHNHGRWTAEEEKLYLEFVIEFAPKNPSWFDKVSGQKRPLYFKAMSEFIGTRSPEQCRSKDQKMQNQSCFLNRKKGSIDRDHPTSDSPQGNKMGISKEKGSDQNRISFLENYFGSRMKEGFSLLCREESEDSVENIDKFFDFGTDKNSLQALKFDLDDHIGNF